MNRRGFFAMCGAIAGAFALPRWPRRPRPPKVVAPPGGIVRIAEFHVGQFMEAYIVDDRGNRYPAKLIGPDGEIVPGDTVKAGDRLTVTVTRSATAAILGLCLLFASPAEAGKWRRFSRPSPAKWARLAENCPNCHAEKRPLRADPEIATRQPDRPEIGPEAQSEAVRTRIRRVCRNGRCYTVEEAYRVDAAGREIVEPSSVPVSPEAWRRYQDDVGRNGRFNRWTIRRRR